MVNAMNLLYSSVYVHMFSAMYSVFDIPRECMLYMYSPDIYGFLLPRVISACLVPHPDGYDMSVPPYPYLVLSQEEGVNRTHTPHKE